jgi:hypothetical protein
MRCKSAILAFDGDYQRLVAAITEVCKKAVNEHRGKDRVEYRRGLEAEQRQPEGASNGKTVPPRIPPIVQSKGAAKQKPSAYLAPLVVFMLILPSYQSPEYRLRRQQ